MGMLLVVFVSTRAAGPEGTRHLLEQAPLEILDHLLLLWADGSFSRTDFSNWVDEHSERLVEIIKLPIMLKALLSSLVAGWCAARMAEARQLLVAAPSGVGAFSPAIRGGWTHTV